MKQDCRQVSIVILGAALLAQHFPLRAETGDAAAVTAPAASASSDGVKKQLAPIIADLAGEDFQTREAAQKRLNAIDPHNVGLLRQAGDGTADVEVKARLVRRIEEMEDYLAMNPGDISLDFKNATIDEVVRALRDAGVAMPTPLGFGQNGPRFTLTVSHQPFTSVIRELVKQHPFEIVGTDDSIVLNAQPGKVHAVSWSPNAVVMEAWSNALGVAAGNQYVVVLGIGIDPRVKIAACEAKIDHAEDEFGAALAPLRVETAYGTSAFGRWAVRVEMPAASQQIAVLKGVVHVTLSLREDTVELNEPEKHTKENILLGKGARFTMTTFEGNADHVACNVGSWPTQEGMAAALAAGTIQSRAEWTPTGKVIDANGKTILTITPGAGTGITGKGIAVPPLKMRVSVPVKTREVSIPFELHNIMLK